MQAITTSDLRWHKKHVSFAPFDPAALHDAHECWPVAESWPECALVQIARLLTVKREREIKQGIDQRTSRNMEK